MRLNAARQLLELVARVDVGPLLDVAPADGVAHVAQVLQRLDDHVPHHRPQREHRQKPNDDGRHPQPGPILGQSLDRLLIVDRHAHHRHQVALLELRIRCRPQRGVAAHARLRHGVHRLVVLVRLADHRRCSTGRKTGSLPGRRHIGVGGTGQGSGRRRAFDQLPLRCPADRLPAAACSTNLATSVPLGSGRGVARPGLLQYRSSTNFIRRRLA